MFRTIGIIGLTILTATGAHARCATPELELSIDKSIGGYSDDTEISLSFNIPLGPQVKRLCDKEIAILSNEAITEFNKARKEEAEARKKSAEAREQEQDNLEQKIEICSEFTTETAPGSIKKFCGDLITQ